MKNKMWLLVSIIFLVTGCITKESDRIKKGDYAYSKEKIEITYGVPDYEVYLNLSDKAKQEYLKSISINDYQTKEDIYEVAMIKITESSVLEVMLDGNSEEIVKLEDKFEEVIVPNVYKVKSKYDKSDKSSYYVFKNQILYLVNERENGLVFHKFYAVGTEQYNEMIRKQNSIDRQKEDEESISSDEDIHKDFSVDNYTAISYETAMRNESMWINSFVKISGKVLQVQNGNGVIHYRIGTQNNGYDGVFLVEISKDALENRILEDDWVTVYGRSFGVTEYTTVMNVNREIPAIVADKITID